MPEMPEVETIARRLRRRIIGKQIAEVRLSGYALRRPWDGNFAGQLSGRRVLKILRRGKYLVAELEPKSFWLIHLGMSGRVLYHPETGTEASHTHVVVRFSDSTELEYRDPRRFGLMAFYDVPRLNMVPEIRSLGIDPLASGFKCSWLQSELKKCRQEIKSFLLDQRRVAGLGNIYVCESLFHAGIHPQRRCLTITHGETARLTDAIRKVMRSSIQRRGTSFSDFVDSDGIPGENQDHLMVFQREGQECLRCGAPIDRILQGNRSTFFCCVCQPKNGGRND
jgi:formamidopyrimidine-DNA glycosylase